MKHESLGKAVVRCLMVPMLMALWVGTAVAQEDTKKANDVSTKQADAKKADDSSPDKAEASKKPRKKPRGRLPMYYSRVVTEKQRLEIYDVQAKFNDQIEALKEQLEKLINERDAEVEQVLSEEQQAEVEKLRNARRAAQKSKAAGESESSDS